jgi:hypothetical protein
VVASRLLSDRQLVQENVVTYTVATMGVPRPVYDYIKGLMDRSGYSHRAGIDMLDMNQIALTPDGDKLPGPAGRDFDDLGDAILFFTEVGFRAGYGRGCDDFAKSGVTSMNACKAWDEYEPSEDTKDAAADLVIAFSNLIRAALTAENEPSMSIIRQAATLMKPKLDATEVRASEVADRAADLTRLMQERGFTFDMEAAQRFMDSIEMPQTDARVGRA